MTHPTKRRYTRLTRKKCTPFVKKYMICGLFNAFAYCRKKATYMHTSTPYATHAGISTHFKTEKKVFASTPEVLACVTKKTGYGLCIGYCLRAHRKANSSIVAKINTQEARTIKIILFRFSTSLFHQSQP